MRFGFLLFARDIDAVGPDARFGEAQGFDLVGMGDAPSLLHDPYLSLAVAALNTTRIRLGPTVTNPNSRHPLLLANLVATLERLAPGRSFLGIGTGNAAVRSLGTQPASLEQLARTVEIVRGLLKGEMVDVDGAELSLRFGSPRPVPILIAGSGRRSLRLAGRLADVAFIAVGASPPAVARAIEWVREGARSAGRDPAAIECWGYIDAAIAQERADALQQVTVAAVARANIVFRGPAARRLSSPLREQVAQLIREYDYTEHMKPGRSANYRLAERLGIAEVLVEEFAIAGTPEDCRRRIQELREVGLQSISFNLSTASDLQTSLRLLGEHVLPEFARA